MVLELLEVVLELLELVLGLLELVLELLELVLSLSLSYLNVFLVSAVGVGGPEGGCPEGGPPRTPRTIPKPTPNHPNPLQMVLKTC